MNNYFKHIITLSLLFILVSPSSSQQTYFQKKFLSVIDTNVTTISLANSPFIEVQDNHYPAQITNVQHRDTKTRLSFLIDHNIHSPLPDSAYYQLELKTLWANQNKDTFQYFAHLILNPTIPPFHHSIIPPSTNSTDRSELQWMDAYWLQAKVLRIRDRQGNILAMNSLPPSLTLELSIETNERYACPPNIVYNLSATFHPASKQIKIQWNGLPCASFYELEWVDVDDYQKNSSVPVPSSQLKYYFPRKAMRIRTYQNFYALPAVFRRGYVIFRVRAVTPSQYPNISISQYLPWSLPDNYDWNTRKGSNSISTVPSPCKIHINENNRYEPKKNYEYEFIADEEGKAHHRITYYDGLYLKKQEIDLFSPTSGDSIAIVKEWVYDVMGRPTIETLPSVEWKPDYLNYYPNLNVDSATGLKYSYPHFMKSTNPNCYPAIIPNPMSENSGASKYYSGSNTDLTYWQMQQSADRMIPDAGHYPFSMQIYSNEPDSRVKETGAAGKTFQPGNGHSVKYYYGSPVQEELDRLLGNNAGIASFYTKILKKDENGQFSIDIKDVKGNTVISGLEKKANNLEDVDTATTTLTSILIQKQNGELSDGETVMMPERDWSKTLVTSGGNVSVTYSVTVPSFTDPCKTSECYDCVYDWEMFIKDECGQSYWSKNNWTSGLGSGSFPAPTDTLNFVCNSPTRTLSADTTALWREGEMYLHRRMVLDSLSMENYFQQWIKNNPCIKTYEDFLHYEMSYIDSSLCDLGCSDCGSDSLCIQICQDSLASLPLCDYERMLMEADMMPMGQYAKYIQDTVTGNITVSDYYSVFYSGTAAYSYFPKVRMWSSASSVNLPNKPGNNYSLEPAYKYPNTYLAGNWLSYYVDEDGLRDTVWLDTDPAQSNTFLYDTTKKWNFYGIYYTFPQYLTVKSFVNKFNFSWAKCLLVYHPEFFYWWNCISEVQPATGIVHGYTLNTFSFDDTLKNHPEWLMDTNFVCKIWQIDPFFVSSSGTNTSMGDDWDAPYKWNASGGWCPPFTASAQSRLRDQILNYASGKSLYQIVDKLVNCNASWNVNSCFALDTSSGTAQLFAERYAAVKRDILLEYLHKRAMLTKSYNGSMGPHAKQGTQLWKNSPCIGSATHPYWDFLQISNTATYYLLKDRIKRWGKSVEYIDTTLTSHTDSLTGIGLCQCKNEFSLEALLMIMFNDSNFIGTKNIDTCFLYTPDLYALTGGEFTWQSYLTNNNQTLQISTGGNCNIGIPNITIELQIDSPAWLSWNYPRLVSLQNLHYTSSSNNIRNFRMTLWYKDSLGNYLPTYLQGRTCFPLEDCGTQPGTAPVQCTLNCLGNDIVNFIFYLDSSVQLVGTYSITPSHLGPCLNTLLQDTFSATPAYYTWQSPYSSSGNVAYFYDGLSGNGIKLIANKNFSSLPSPLHSTGYKMISCLNAGAVPPTRYCCGNALRFFYPRRKGMDSVDVHLFKINMKTNQSTELPLFCCEEPDADTCIAFDFPPVDSIEIDSVPDPCISAQIANAAFNAQNYYQQYIDSLQKDFYAKYKNACWKIKELLAVRQTFKGNYYTLYNYDEAENLLQTVPPKGVVLLDSLQIVQVQKYRNTLSATPVYPNDSLKSEYRYNSQNLEIQRKTPDAGITLSYYDNNLRLAASQNAQQKHDTLFAFTKYDYKSRPVESGVGKISSLNFSPAPIILSNANHPNNWLSQKREVVKTIYDIPISQYPNIPISQYPFTQTHLRGRVSAITRDEDNNGQPEHAYIYSYDILGNVWDLWQYIAELKPYNNHWKQTRYEFDLISGKVKKLFYQTPLLSGGGGGGLDQYLHKYFYNADNKLLSVQTSRDGWYWEQDAKYEYYLHGPLKRTELGERKVQGLDYVYTINGWQKGLNAGIQDSSKDAGADGLVGGLNQFIGKDVLTFALQYFHSDYKAISVAGNNSELNISQSLSNFVPLYNGNIASTIISQDTMQPLARAYRYDALNRLKEQKPFLVNHNLFTPIQSWATNYAYDKMGNITFLSRNALSEMDRLKYFYYPQSNKLSFITDSVPTAAFSNDIDNQNPSNYTYDLVGNLIQDNSEKLRITWTHYGKVKQIDSIINSTTTQPKLSFTYDALGNRLIKEKTSPTGGGKEGVIYLRDAQGNLIALYEIKNDSLFAKEFYMYGSQRLGYTDENIFLAKKNKISNFPISNFSTLKYSNQTPRNVNYTFGKKRYELNDWLGNVRVVISDKKIPVVSGNSVTGYSPDVLSVTDYYPFGFEIAQRTYSHNEYRFGFSGKEMDNEISGSGNHLDFTFRGYDSRRGQFWSVDPLTKFYPMLTPYQYAGNRPIDGIDLEGTEYVTYIVRLYNEGSGAAVVDKIDYRGIKNFNYKKYSESFGPEGRGVKFIYQYVNDAGWVYKIETGWDVRQGRSLTKTAIGTHGFFYGEGAKTILGPKYDPVPLGTPGNHYDWRITPTDLVDAIAREHDWDQEEKGIFDWLEDTRTLKGDLTAIARWNQYVADYAGTEKLDPYTNKKASREAIRAAKSGSAFFGILTQYKEWKIREMKRQGLDQSNPDDMRKITIDDYKGKWYQFGRNAGQKILKSSSDED